MSEQRSIDYIDESGHEWTEAQRYRNLLAEVARLQAERDEALKHQGCFAAQYEKAEAKIEEQGKTILHMNNLKLEAESALVEATKRCEELERAARGLLAVEDDPTIFPAYSGELQRRRDAALKVVREALRSTPAAKTLRCERCGYCRDEVVCTHCGAPAPPEGDNP